MPTIGLCMIAKDEAHVILRCLESVRPLVDYVLIEDTGSTDGTQAVVRKWLERVGLPGKVVEESWQGFAYNRTHALARLRENTSVDYAFIMDADDYLVAEEGFDAAVLKRSLSLDMYSVPLRGGGVRYARNQICRNRCEFRYRGVLHEFLEAPPGEISSGSLTGFYITSTREGARGKDPGTYRKDTMVLEQALLTETDPFLCARYTFYLARSYRDCGDNENALKHFLARAELGHWIEEVFYSLYSAGKLLEELGRPLEEVVAAYLRASDAVPGRAEALHAACRLCRTAGRNQQGYEIGKRGLMLSEPYSGLFVEPWVYDYGLRDEFEVNAYWSEHYHECLEVCLELLARNTLPAGYRERIITNARFALAKLPRKAAPDSLDVMISSAGAMSPSVPLTVPALRATRTRSDMVSVITPTRNRDRFLKNALGYFRSQDYGNIEWLVLDDSQEPTASCAELPDKNVSYQYVEKQLSIGEKRNILIDRAHGEIIVQFDDDDYYTPNYVSSMIAVLGDRDADLINLRGWFLYDIRSHFFGYWDLMQKEGLHYRCDRAGVALTMFNPQTTGIFDNNHYGFGFSYAFKKKVWDSVKFPDIDWNEDGQFSLKASSKFKVDGIHDTTGLCLHFLHTGSTSRCFPQHRLPRFLLQRIFPALDWLACDFGA